MKTDVVIIGGGPSGLLLSQLLMRAGISTVVLERQTRDYVLSRIRAGVLEWGTVELLREAGVGDRMAAEGFPHDAVNIASDEHMLRVDLHALTGKRVMVYGQTEVTLDLYRGQDALGATILHEVSEVEIGGIDGDAPFVTFTHEGEPKRITCAHVVGCDGFHGVSRGTIPAAVQTNFEKVYPFGWLGILSHTKPAAEELIYTSSERGFALASMRNPGLSRSYIQVPLTEGPEDWSDEAFWAEFTARFPADIAKTIEQGPSFEKSVAPLRSFVSEPMQYGRLYLCGDAAHIVPPTGAKGLNLAASDVFYLSRALIAAYKENRTDHLARYGADALARVWQAMRFSWTMTMLLHRFPDHGPYDRKMQVAEIDLLARSETAQRLFAENYVGLPY